MLCCNFRTFGDPRVYKTIRHGLVDSLGGNVTTFVYEQWMPGAKRLLSSDVHINPPSLRQSFVLCNRPDAKVAALRDLLGVPDGDGKPSLGRLVIFTNSQGRRASSTTRWLTGTVQ